MELGTVLAEHRNEMPPAGGKVMAEAEERGWIRPFGQGQYLYTRLWTRLLRSLQSLILERAVNNLGFEEWIFPRLIPRDALDSFKLTQFNEGLLMKAGHGDTIYLDPVQCISLYQNLRGSRLKLEQLPLKIVECLGGWTWRNETAATLDGPYRATEFARVEHVFVGTPQQVREIRRSVQRSLTELLTMIGLSWHVVVGNGCMDIPSVVKARQEAIDADDIPVQDIEIPIRGALRNDGRRVANFDELSHHKLENGRLQLYRNDPIYVDADEICGCSVEGNHLTHDFDIAASDGQELWSGCCGIGLNRLIIGFLYQHGFNESNWPELILNSETVSR